MFAFFVVVPVMNRYQEKGIQVWHSRTQLLLLASTLQIPKP